MPYKPLKLWFDKELAEQLSEKLLSVRSDFNSTAFIKKVDTGVDGLKLKDRVELIADELNNHLEDDYPKQVEVLLQIIGPENEEETGMFKEYYWIMPIAKFVEKFPSNSLAISVILGSFPNFCVSPSETILKSSTVGIRPPGS